MERNRPNSAPRIPAIVHTAAHSIAQRKFIAAVFPTLATIALLSIISFVILMLSSCTSSIPSAKRPAPVAKKNVASAVAKPLLPEGWADITSRSKQPQIIQWIVNREYSATMVLRELQTDSLTMRELMKEGMNVVAEISLRGKVPHDDADFRVTRVPELAVGKRKISSYVFTERGLLRRVAVFIRQNRIMELELMQEQSGAAFDELTGDLLEFAGMVQDR